MQEGRKEERKKYLVCTRSWLRIDAIDARSRIIEALDRGQAQGSPLSPRLVDNSARCANVEVELEWNSLLTARH